jgi:hypothetical protein
MIELFVPHPANANEQDMSYSTVEQLPALNRAKIKGQASP